MSDTNILTLEEIASAVDNLSEIQLRESQLIDNPQESEKSLQLPNFQEVHDSQELIAGSSIFEFASGSDWWRYLTARFIEKMGLKEYQEIIEKATTKENAMKELILSILSKCKTQHQMVARYASIFLKEFSVSDLKAVVPSVIKASVEESLEYFSSMGLIEVVKETDFGSTFSFPNDIVRNAIYNLTCPRLSNIVNIVALALSVFDFVCLLACFLLCVEMPPKSI